MNRRLEAVRAGSFVCLTLLVLVPSLTPPFPPRLRIPSWKGLGADSEEKHEPVSDIDAAVVDYPGRPIREADIAAFANLSVECPRNCIVSVSSSASFLGEKRTRKIAENSTPVAPSDHLSEAQFLARWLGAKERLWNLLRQHGFTATNGVLGVYLTGSKVQWVFCAPGHRPSASPQLAPCLAPQPSPLRLLSFQG